MEAYVKKDINKNAAYYTIFWSSFKKAEKFDIVTCVPSISGIFELYYQDKKKKLNLFFLSKAYYGGLKYEIRKRTDPEMETDPQRKKIIEKYDCYYRYAATNSYQDMKDIFYFFARTYLPHVPAPAPSGRYEDIFIEEISKDKIVDI